MNNSHDLSRLAEMETEDVSPEREAARDFKRWMDTGLGIGQRQPKDQEEESNGVPKY